MAQLAQLQSSVPVGWIPTALRTDGSRWLVEWIDGHGLAFAEPFCVDTVRRARRLRVSTPVSALRDVAARGRALPLAGLIFHTSRCGSTLACQMLKSLGDTLVLSEPSPLDDVLRAPGLDHLTRERWLGWMVAALVQPVHEQQRHAVIKLDAWATRDLPLIRRAFPDTPWVFLYRDPVEVVASQLRLPGLPALAGGLPPALFGLELSEALALGRAGYCAHVIATVCDDALTHLDDGGLALSYDALPDAVWDRVLAHLHLSLSPGVRPAMRAVASRDAKRPQLPFDDSRQAPALDDPTRDMVNRVAGRAFAGLQSWAPTSTRAREIA